MAANFYKEYLRSPRWQKKRLEIFNRDNFTCTKCNNTEEQLEVHHLDYLPELKPWEYPMDMMVTLCSSCHNKENNRELLEKHLATTLKMNGFLYGDLIALSCAIETIKDFKEYILKFIRRMQNG